MGDIGLKGYDTGKRGHRLEVESYNGGCGGERAGKDL